jgi:hypothetical protein
VLLLEGSGPGLELFPELFALEGKVTEDDGGVNVFVLVAVSFIE